MAAAGRFVIYPPSFTYAGPTTLDLTYVNRIGFQSGSKVNRIEVAGAVDPGANIVATADPMVMTGTRSLSALLGVVNPTTGLSLTGGGVLRFQQRDDGAAIFVAGGTHVTEAYATGFFKIDSISANQDDESGAEAQCRVYITSSDGITNPITRSVTGTISGVTPAFGTEYYLGPVYTGGAVVPGIKSVAIDFGTTCSPFRSSGAVFPTSVSLTKRAPVIRVVCHKLSGDAGASMFLRAISTSFICYLQQGADSGLRTAVGSSVHVKISASDGAWHVESIEGQGLDDALVTWVMYPKANITYTAVSTIP